MPVYSFVGYCRCGCEVWIEYFRDNGGWVPQFFDQDRRRITRCPDCGAELNEDDLASR
jgi:hypothetical protein